MITQWLSLLTLLFGIVLWLGAMRSRERALHAARGICKSQEVQLLDETVGLDGLRLRRHHGWLQCQLRYGFEVSLHGHDRYTGHLWMAGGRVVGLHTSWPQPSLDAVDVSSKVSDLLGRLRPPDGNGAT